jgi:hypothetical protein
MLSAETYGRPKGNTQKLEDFVLSKLLKSQCDGDVVQQRCNCEGQHRSRMDTSHYLLLPLVTGLTKNSNFLARVDIVWVWSRYQ